MECKNQAALDHVRAHIGEPNVRDLDEAAYILYDIFCDKDEEFADVLNCPLCQNFLAVAIWRKTIGVGDCKMAYELLLKAAKSGNAKAQANLGTFFRVGALGFYDYGAAKYWYTQAAKGGDQIGERNVRSCASLFPKELTGQGHGNHLEACSRLGLQATVKKTLTGGKLTSIIETVTIAGDGCPELRKVYTLDVENKAVSTRALIVEKEGQNQAWTLYPFMDDGTLYEVYIENIYEWENGIEATIEGRIGERLITFFMSDYYLNKCKIARGGSYSFKLSALAYSCELLKETTFKFEGEKAIDYLLKIGEPLSFDENGDVEPVVFYLDKMVAFLQSNKDYPDDVQYQSPVQSVEQVGDGDDAMYKIEIAVSRDSDIFLPLYVKRDLVDFEIAEQTPILGLGWVQGVLRDSKYHVLPDKGCSYVLDENGEPMIAYGRAKDALLYRKPQHVDDVGYFLNIRRPIIMESDGVYDDAIIEDLLDNLLGDLPDECDGIIFKNPQTGLIDYCYVTNIVAQRWLSETRV